MSAEESSTQKRLGRVKNERTELWISRSWIRKMTLKIPVISLAPELGLSQHMATRTENVPRGPESTRHRRRSFEHGKNNGAM